MMDKVKKNSKYLQVGLSLVELSIVMVIIGLLVGAVAGGLSIKKSSELRSIITQVDQFRVAISGFQDKYGDLPGDMPDAHSYWDNGSNTVCGTAAECNGDGNGEIEYGSDSDAETFRFWQHLSLAGFIEGQYTGSDIDSGTGALHVPYINCPATSRTSGGYHVRTHTNDTETVASTNIAVGGYEPVIGWPSEKLLSAAEAYYIDNKTDDGDADNGKSQARSNYDATFGWLGACVAGVEPNRTYIKTISSPDCIMFFDIK